MRPEPNGLCGRSYVSSKASVWLIQPNGVPSRASVPPAIGDADCFRSGNTRSVGTDHPGGSTYRFGADAYADNRVVGDRVAGQRLSVAGRRNWATNRGQAHRT